jgi:DNA-binding GntR family transcriptional regulator
MLTAEPSLERDNISDSVAATLRNMIVDGRLPDGERINEVRLAQQLGISRTPVREALSRLTQEGAVQNVPRIGYFVRPLTVEEFEQIYEIRPLLDPEALLVSGIPSRGQLKRLREINNQMRNETDADVIIALDDDFHLELLAGCKNLVLMDLIRQFIQRTRRYEIALMRERSNVQYAAQDHERILRALAKGQLDKASAELKKNLQSGRAPIVEWLKARGAAKGRTQ